MHKTDAKRKYSSAHINTSIQKNKEKNHQILKMINNHIIIEKNYFIVLFDRLVKY